MDIAAISIGMQQASLQNAVSVSVLKIVMNSEEHATTQMSDMISNIALDENRGMNIDARI